VRIGLKPDLELDLMLGLKLLDFAVLSIYAFMSMALCELGVF
jgi:hypothetical protein